MQQTNKKSVSGESVHVCVSLIVSIWRHSGLAIGRREEGGGAAALSTEHWVGSRWQNFGDSAAAFPPLLAGDFCQTLVCRTRTNLEWPVAAERNWPPRSHALVGKRGDNYSSSFSPNFCCTVLSTLSVRAPRPLPKICLCSFETLTFFSRRGKNKDHADTVVPLELAET